MTARWWLVIAFPAALAGVACSNGLQPTPALTTRTARASRGLVIPLTIQASDSCKVGDGGLPLKKYTVMMQEVRSSSASHWTLAEDRAVGPKDIQLVLRLNAGADPMTGTMSGPALIETELGTTTVYPSGAVTVRISGDQVAGTWNGRLSAWRTVGGTVISCDAGDHGIALVLPLGRATPR